MTRVAKNKNRRLAVESLESRHLMASLPFGASADDTAEYMLGRVAVTPVFLESDGTVDASTENWTSAQVTTVMNNIQAGLNWWTQLLATKSTVHNLEWVIDRTYVDQQPKTPYEPISRRSNDYVTWVGQFMTDIGYSQSQNLETNVRAFNNAQRQKLNTDWSFTIFVVNSQNDADGGFAVGGSFTRAFSFAGGLFEVVPSTRPASTFAHETGHEFWARDEYSGGGNYYQYRGYYNAQNTNAIDLNPNPNFQQQVSIMSAGAVLQSAYDGLVTSDATLAQIGWKDSDNDGIFDVLDVPLKLEGTGRLNTAGTQYNFVGRATVQTMPNTNSQGLQNDITLNKVDRVEYRINGGAWTIAASPGTYTANLNLQIPISQATGKIEIRAIDSRTGITSNIFSGTLGATPDTTTLPGIQGFAYRDTDKNKAWASTEPGFAGATITLIDANNQPLVLQKSIEPDDYAGPLTGTINGARIDTVGDAANGSIGAYIDSRATTGTKIFKPYSIAAATFVEAFNGSNLQLRARFDNPTSYVSIDAVAVGDNTTVRLDAYSADGTLIKRGEAAGLLNNQVAKLEVSSGDATISYVIVRGAGSSFVKLDNLKYGPASTTTTASDGSYVFPNLPAGSYAVQISYANPGYSTSTPSSGTQSIILGSSPATHVDFGVSIDASPWQNPVQREDVNNNKQVEPLDVLVIINEINRNGTRGLDNSGLSFPPYFDVDGDRVITALDVLIVINYINRQTGGSSGGSAEGESAPLASSSSVRNDLASSGPVTISESDPPFTSFALDKKANERSTWIANTNINRDRASIGAEKCGCPACTSFQSDVGESSPALNDIASALASAMKPTLTTKS